MAIIRVSALGVVGLIVVGGLLAFTAPGCKPKPVEPTRLEDDQSALPSFTEEVEQILARKVGVIEELASEPIIVNAVRKANKKNAKKSLDELLKQDAHWQEAKGIDELIKSVLTNECADFLAEFQETNQEFPEIFVTDRKGVIVAETNKTSDYYQADEEWWIETMRSEQGNARHGPIEYDESAQSEAISIYVPIVDDKTSRRIGVLKAVCDITAIKMEL